MKIKQFRNVYIDATTLDDCWFQLLNACYEQGRKYLITEGSYAGEHRLALDDASGFIAFPHTRPLSPILPNDIPPPTTDNDIEKYFVNYLMRGDLEGNEDYKYGTFIVGGKYEIPNGILTIDEWEQDSPKFRGTRRKNIYIPNQLEWIINHFKTKGFGNEHCYITVGYPESNFAYDIPYTTEIERKTSACCRGLDFRIIESQYFKCPECNSIWEEHQLITTNGQNRLCPLDREIHLEKWNGHKKYYLTTKVIYRSWDLWGGFPENMGGFSLLNEYVAGELGVEPGPLSFACKSLHCYSHHTDILKLRLRK